MTDKKMAETIRATSREVPPPEPDRSPEAPGELVRLRAHVAQLVELARILVGRSRGFRVDSSAEFSTASATTRLVVTQAVAHELLASPTALRVIAPFLARTILDSLRSCVLSSPGGETGEDRIDERVEMLGETGRTVDADGIPLAWDDPEPDATVVQEVKARRWFVSYVDIPAMLRAQGADVPDDAVVTITRTTDSTANSRPGLTVEVRSRSYPWRPAAAIFPEPLAHRSPPERWIDEGGR